jgi:hypothetical protein
MNMSLIKEVLQLFLTKHFYNLKKVIKFKVGITEMYPRIPWMRRVHLLWRNETYHKVMQTCHEILK